MGYFFFKIYRLMIIANAIKIMVPEIIGERIKSYEAPDTITIIGFEPAGGWVTFKKIIKNIPIPTVIGIIKKIGKLK